ncbi:MAG TPA: hypothetical protein VGM23_17995 [Armatimonadota bacterium]
MRQHFTIIDEHIHTYPADIAAKILGPFAEFHQLEPTHIGNGTIEEVLAVMSQGGIDFTILANFAPTHLLHNNNLWTLETARQHP